MVVQQARTHRPYELTQAPFAVAARYRRFHQVSFKAGTGEPIKPVLSEYANELGKRTILNNDHATPAARNVTDLNEDFLRGKRFLILDRDTKYCEALRGILVREGIGMIRLPPRAPNLNAFAERFVRSIKSECLNRMIFFGAESLRHAIRELVDIITPNEIIRDSETACCSQRSALAILTPMSIGASVLEGCSAITTVPRPDEFRCYFWPQPREMAIRGCLHQKPAGLLVSQQVGHGSSLSSGGGPRCGARTYASPDPARAARWFHHREMRAAGPRISRYGM